MRVTKTSIHKYRGKAKVLLLFSLKFLRVAAVWCAPLLAALASAVTNPPDFAKCKF